MATRLEDSNRGRTIAFSTHGNAAGLFPNWIDGSVGRIDAERPTNPDVAKVVCQGGEFKWDRHSVLSGIRAFSTDHTETPVDE